VYPQHNNKKKKRKRIYKTLFYCESTNIEVYINCGCYMITTPHGFTLDPHLQWLRAGTGLE
jgi:hypothetical protein